MRSEWEGFRLLRLVLNLRNPSPSHTFGAGPSLSQGELPDSQIFAPSIFPFSHREKEGPAA